MKAIVINILIVLLTVFISINVLALPAGDFPLSNEGAEVITVFAAQRKQPHPTFTTDKDRLDTIWILFSDGQFRQFVIMDDEFLMFSCGTYEDTSGPEVMTGRTGKYMEGAGFRNYSSVHPFVLNTDEYARLVVSGKKDRRVSGVYGLVQQGEMPDTYLITYSDGTFERYGAVDGSFVLSDEGTSDSMFLPGPEQEEYTALYID